MKPFHLVFGTVNTIVSSGLVRSDNASMFKGSIRLARGRNDWINVTISELSSSHPAGGVVSKTAINCEGGAVSKIPGTARERTPLK
jgi:hypothetical protein